ncbi:MAG: alginate export family protein [Beijerinckiaceae bacterium]
MLPRREPGGQHFITDAGKRTGLQKVYVALTSRKSLNATLKIPTMPKYFCSSAVTLEVRQIAVRHMFDRTRALASFIAIAFCLYLASSVLAPSRARAQISAAGGEVGRLESVAVRIENPSGDKALDNRLADRVRVGLGIYPGEQFSRSIAEFNLARARRTAPIARTTLVVEPGPTGGLEVTVLVMLGPSVTGPQARGSLVTGKARDLPVLYDRDGKYLRMRLESIAMYYGNNNAWYGNPGALLAGNPLVRGKTAGRGYRNWTEGFVHAGLYGITPLSENISLYGGFSGVFASSVGQELFTNQTRGYFGVEDAFVGVVGGTTSPDGDRLIVNASFGRQRFSVSDGFLIANTASNGGNRGALQSNPRWAADSLFLFQARYNNTKIEAFHIDPDELPVVDSKTRIAGVNLETKVPGGFDLGAMYLHVPKSNFGYFTATDKFTREGLQVYNARMRWQPNPAGAGPFVAAEAALQRHDRIDMRAFGWTTEVGYTFADTLPWSPTISYRYASFSGDKPWTKRFERWDPLLSGENGERWVQGINHFKIFQNSNLSTHRLQLRLRPHPKIELVPQLWVFTADQTNNIGGNPALSALQGRYLGTEANLTFKWFISPQLLMQGHVAATFPSASVRKLAGLTSDPWISTMVFLRAGL